MGGSVGSTAIVDWHALAGEGYRKSKDMPQRIRQVAASFLAGAAGGASLRPSSALRQVELRRGQMERLTEPLSRCPDGAALMILPAPGAEAPLRYRVRAREQGAEADPLVRCAH